MTDKKVGGAGLRGQVAGETALCTVGEVGTGLTYRGYDITDLANNAAGNLAGLGPELAPRLPVAAMSAAFVALFFFALRREFGVRGAFYAAALLATSAGWIAFSQVAVTDVPLAACFGGSMLAALRWLKTGSRPVLALAGGLLGLAVLAKGLVPLVLILPLVWSGRRRWRQLPLLFAACLLVAAPWYAMVWVRNGEAFFVNFIWKHHIQRFATEALAHRQPFWFYLPVLPAGLFPWTPLVALLARARMYREARLAYLLATLAFGLVFFSASTNKLPGYLLPLLPAAAALMGVALAEIRDARWWLAAAAGLLVLLPVIAAVLPQALENGLSRSRVDAGAFWLGLPLGLAAGLVYLLEARGKRPLAVAALAGAVAVSVAVVKARTFPLLDQRVSARSLWREIAPLPGGVCVENLHRNWRYGLNYYSIDPLPPCDTADGTAVVRQPPGKRPVVVRAAGR